MVNVFILLPWQVYYARTDSKRRVKCPFLTQSLSGERDAWVASDLNIKNKNKKHLAGKVFWQFYQFFKDKPGIPPPVCWAASCSLFIKIIFSDPTPYSSRHF